MDDVIEFFSSAQGFLLSALGSGVVALGLSYPWTCYRLVGGEWEKCLTPSPCGGPLASRCENILGLDAFADHQGTAAIIALVAGLLCGLVAAGLSSVAKDRSQKQAV